MHRYTLMVGSLHIFLFPPTCINMACDRAVGFPTKFLLYQINHTRNNRFSGLCLPVMLQAVSLGAFPPEPKALTFSHQQPALKRLSLCSSCAPGGKEEWKPPVTELAPASLMSDLIFRTQILPLAKKTFAFLNSSSYTVKSSIWKQRPWVHSWTFL